MTKTEYSRLTTLLRDTGVPFLLHYAPCCGPRREVIQAEALSWGHNVTTRATIGVQLGREMLVFFVGASDVAPELAGAFMFRFNVDTLEITHNTLGRAIIAQ